MLDIERSVELFTDIHGHSRKFNVFLYGCQFQDPGEDPKSNALIKVFPLIMDSKCENFSYKDCTFAL